MSSIQDMTSAVTLLVILAALGGIVALGIWGAGQLRGPRTVPAPVASDEVRSPSPLVPNRSSLPAAQAADSSRVRVAEVETAGAERYAGTATVLAADTVVAVLAVRRLAPGLLYEFRGRRYDRFQIDLLAGASGVPTPRVVTVQQPLPLLQAELQAQAGLGYTGRPALLAAATGLRVWGLHLGAFAGIELATADVLAGPYVSATVFRTAALGVGRDVAGGRYVLAATITF